MPYELIITEKPQAAMKIAYALADIAPIKKSMDGVPYYELKHDDSNIVVACAVGHLFGLEEMLLNLPLPAIMTLRGKL